jgi:TonB family protein
MIEAWERWQGQIVNGEFPLSHYLGGSDHSAVFLTERGAREPQKAAIKLISAALDPEIQLARWQVAATLSHPCLIRLFETGRCQLGEMEILYVVMEYADEDLSQILSQRPLTPQESREMLQPVLEALAYIHGKGLVHGHIKPANIMAIGDQVKVSTDGLSLSGESIGEVGRAPAYASPEIKGGTVSPASDVWSLGTTLVEALTQRPPVWEGTEQQPVVPQTMPEPFLGIARQCLQKDPQRRWTVAEIAARLQPTLPELRKQATPQPEPVPAWRRYTGPLIAAGLVLLAILAVPRILNRSPERAPSSAGEQPRNQPKRDSGLGMPGAGQSTAGDQERSSSASAPSQAGLQSQAGAKPATGSPRRGEVIEQVLPDVPRSARDTIQGKVRVSVRVAVDASGSVTDAKFQSRGPSAYFANLALKAARRWKFMPPQVDGKDASSEWLLRFEFKRTGTDVHPVQAAP